MSSDPQARAGDPSELEAAVDQAISACGGDLRPPSALWSWPMNILRMRSLNWWRPSRTPMRGGASRPIRA